MSTATIDQVRRYWDARPCNIRHSTAPVGSLEWSWDITERKYFVEPHIKEFAQFYRWNGRRVLEIGCGIGTDTLEFLRAGAEVHAVDLSMESLKLAWERQLMEFPPKVGRNLADMTCLNAEDVLPPGLFDLAYSFGVLHHTPRPDLALRNIRDSLEVGGELRIMLYAKRSLKFWFGEQPEAQAGCPVAKTYTGREARKLLTDAGFEVESVTKAHIFPWRVADYVEHRYVKRLAWRFVPEWLFRRLEKLVGHHLLIVARRVS